MEKKSAILDYRKHQTVKKPKNRWRVDAVCDWVMEKTEKEFTKNLSSNSVYFHAYAIKYGDELALKMLSEMRTKNDGT